MLRQTLPVDEVVVVADSCTDDTAAVAASYGAIVVETRQAAKAASQDVGLAYVTGDILVCIDADTVIDDDVVEKFVAELENGSDATCANMLPMPAAARLLGCEPPFRVCARPASGGAGLRPRLGA